MATLALSAAGAAVGGALAPGAGALSGAVLGRAAGALAGQYIDQALFGSTGQERVVEGPRLTELHVLSSSEGAAIARLFGRARLGGQIIWATPFEEERVSSSSGGGGKAAQSSGPRVTQVAYRYFANFAVGLCEGEITRIGRVWADGKEIDLSPFTTRVYLGSEEQPADDLIVASEGGDAAPGYLGIAYIVFERLALERFGNRIPQLTFEVFRALDDFESRIRAVTMIPGAGEFAYDTDEVIRDGGGGTSFPENTHTLQGGTDWSVSIDQLQATAPALNRVALFVSWFGTDLRAGSCEIRPGVERVDKNTVPYNWSVQGLGRGQAHVVSQVEDRPAYGGTPADRSVVAAIQDMNARGLGVTFNPFLLMDIADDNSLPDPYGATSQATYPWRGRITVHPAPGQPGSPDQTAVAAAEIATLVGTAQGDDYSVNGTTVTYQGPAEWSYRRMLLHYAHLCKAAGGVERFLIGSELRGLSQVRSASGQYPFVDALIQLAADVKQILGPQTLVSYAADWSEYFGHQPADGSGDVDFHLDPLWASGDIDAVGIDVYWPLADWRDGEGHLDRLAGASSVYDLDYLSANLTGGEGFDWYYASEADRSAQVRTAITDGVGKPWLFRFKDIKSWWENPHFNRPGGVEAAVPTAWQPRSKPFWFTEVGCAAIDLGANQPNVFFAPTSSESALPYFSQGRRDDLMQRRYLTAILGHFTQTDDPAALDDANPVSPLYGARMVGADDIYLYTWDARPSPAFPAALSVWSDGGNWATGHWLSGRLGGADLAALVARILAECGFSDFDVSGLEGLVQGLVLDRVMSARQALQPLEMALFFDSIATGSGLRFQHRGRNEPVADLAGDALVENQPGATLYTVTRGQGSDLPAQVKFTYFDGDADYRAGAVGSRRLEGVSQRVTRADVPLVLSEGQARQIADATLHDAWATRERAALAVPPSLMVIEPGDVIRLSDSDDYGRFRVTGLTGGAALELEARSVRGEIFDPVSATGGHPGEPEIAAVGPTRAYLMDLPGFDGSDPAPLGWFAAAQSPWPGQVALHRSVEEDGFEVAAVATQPATMGVTVGVVPPGPVARWDHRAALVVRLDQGELTSRSRLAVLGGANRAALRSDDGSWEILQFADAELVAPSTYALSSVLRGQAGTGPLGEREVADGAAFVLLDDAVVAIPLTGDDLDLPFRWTWGPANRPLGHFTYASATLAFTGRPLVPYRAAHARRGGDANGALLQWVRRTRVGGDNWVPRDVPLSEEREAWEVDILDGAVVRRTLVSEAPAVLYSAAMQTADWGAAVPDQFSIAIYQISALRGRGTPLFAEV